MSSKTVAALVVAVLAAGGIAYWTTRDRAGTAAVEADPASSSASAQGRTQLDAPATGERQDVSRPTGGAGDAATDPAAAGSAGKRVDPGARRKVTEAEKESVRELMRMHRKMNPPTDSVAPAEGSVAGTAAQGTDPDSLFLKYGSMGEATMRESVASLRAILAWQDEGPFDDKNVDILAPELRTAFELEIEWLERRLAGQD